MTHATVVGVDGSVPSAAAATWAAREAYRTGRPLRMIHVDGADTGPSETPQERLPQAVLAIRDRIAAALPELELSCERAPGSPAHALAAAGEREGLLVLGSRGLGGFAGLLVGSVGMRTAAHAECPVVLVRAEGDGADPATGEVVVGVRPGRPSEEALAFAFERAAAGGRVLRALGALTPPAGPYETQAPLDQAEIRDSLLASAEADLQDALGPWREKYPDVRVDAEVTPWPAARALLEATHGAALVVLGRRPRPRGPVVVPHLGHVAHTVLHHAHCPVAVVPNR